MTNRWRVLGFHPSSRGFGWVLFEDRASLADWGVVDVVGNENALSRMEILLDRHRPGVLALECHDDAFTRRRRRIQNLCVAVAEIARKRNIAVRYVSRGDIANTELLKGAITRHQVAARVADCLGALRSRLPKPRPIWVGERSAMRLFCAAACVLAYFDGESG